MCILFFSSPFRIQRHLRITKIPTHTQHTARQFRSTPGRVRNWILFITFCTPFTISHTSSCHGYHHVARKCWSDRGGTTFISLTERTHIVLKQLKLSNSNTGTCINRFAQQAPSSGSKSCSSERGVARDRAPML